MAQVYLSLGSNIDPVKHITACLDALAEGFGELQISSVYESHAVGFDGDNFYNLVVGVTTEKTVGELSTVLREIENKNGRKRGGERFSGRTLDIDILTYDDLCGHIDGIKLPRDEITENAFVLQPLAEIAPEALHPLSQKKYKDLWAAYDKSQQVLWPVDFYWRDKKISTASE